jgi:hypothetical protein|tara:strand:+ start:629 stop:823 length:195 start_codon:yes stop_codon:yes gene_type:complete
MELIMSLPKFKKEITKLFKKNYGHDWRDLSISEDLVEISHSGGETPEEFLEWFQTVEDQWCIPV